MAKIKCDKAIEIQKIQSDVNYIKKAIAGNGEIGLIKSIEKTNYEVKKNRDFRKEYHAKSQVYKFLLGAGWFTSIFLFAVSLYLNN